MQLPNKSKEDFNVKGVYAIHLLSFSKVHDLHEPISQNRMNEKEVQATFLC
jgi:hypothetical protein